MILYFLFEIYLLKKDFRFVISVLVIKFSVVAPFVYN